MERIYRFVPKRKSERVGCIMTMRPRRTDYIYSHVGKRSKQAMKVLVLLLRAVNNRNAEMLSCDENIPSRIRVTDAKSD